MTTVNVTWERRFSTMALNIMDEPYGAVGDGVTDDAPALRRALARIPNSTNPWADSRRAGQGVVYLPTPPVAYYFATPVIIPAQKRISLEALGMHGVRITAGPSNVALYRESAIGAFHGFRCVGLNFDGCDVQIQDQSRNWHIFDRCFWKDSPVGLDLLDTAGEGGQVGGEVTKCEFEGCGHGIRCSGQNSDNWLVRNTQFTRQTLPTEIRSSGWSFEHVYWEQHAGADNQPWLQLAGNVSSFSAHRCHFRGDVGTGDPPRDAVVIGEIDTVGTGSVERLTFSHCDLHGRNGGPVAGSGESAIRFNVGVNEFQMFGGSARNYDQVLRFEHGNGNGLAGGFRNFVQVPHSYDAVLTNKDMIRGRGGSWQIDDGGIESVQGAELLSSVDYANVAWTKTNVSVAQDVDGPDGVTNSAFTVTKLASGSAHLAINPPVQQANTPARFTVWLKSVGGSDVELCSLGWFPDYGFLTPIRLTDSWEPYDVWLPNSQAATLYVLLDSIGGSNTGAVHVSAPSFQYGRGRR